MFMRLAKALIRLRVCAGWSEALLVAHTTLLEISCRSSIISVEASYLFYLPNFYLHPYCVSVSNEGSLETGLMRKLAMNYLVILTYLLLVVSSINTRLCRAVGSESDCRSRRCVFDPGPVPYFRGDWSWNNSTVLLFLPLIQEVLSVRSESMCRKYWSIAKSSLPRKKGG